MSVRTHNSSIGIDIGGSSARAVALERHGHAVRISQAVYINRYAEGLVGENEFSGALREWLHTRGLQRTPAVCGLASRLTSEVIYDFPPEHRPGDLRKMVDYQTRQLCGLSEERFISDYQLIGEQESERENVLIGICRESIVDEKCQFFQALGVPVHAMAENGQALANAFAFLHPLESAQYDIRILLDIGQNESTLVLWSRNQPRHIACVPTGGEQFTKFLARQWNCDEMETERRKKEVSDDCQDPDSPCSLASRAFAVELRHALEQWESQSEQNGTRLLRHPGKIWLSGGGALQPCLERTLGNEFQCPVELLGVPRSMLYGTSVQCPAGHEVQTDLTIAFGLALQGLGEGVLKLSLLPERVRWQFHKQSQFPFLLSAFLFMLLTILLVMGLFLFDLKQRIADVTALKENLDKCLVLAPKLNKSYEQIDFYQKQMLPVVEYGTRTGQFIEALKSCRDVLNDKNIPQPLHAIYLADELSFAEACGIKQYDNASPVLAPLAPLERDIFAASAKSAPPPPSTVLPVAKIPVLRNMYLGGLTLAGESRYKTVKEIQVRFHERSTFNNVDDYVDFFKARFDAKYIAEWERFLAIPAERLESRYTFFFLQMPFRESVTARPAATSSPSPERKP